MNVQDKKEIRQIFNEGFEQLILPHFDNIYKNIDDIRKNMATKEDLQDLKQELKGDITDVHNDIGRIDRSLTPRFCGEIGLKKD